MQAHLSEWILYTSNNCGNESVLFRINFVCGDWSSCIGGFTFLSTPFIYHLLSIWIFQYTLLSIAAESRQLLFPIPSGGIAYVNPILTLISVSFALYSAASSTTPTLASPALKSAASDSSSYYTRWVDLLSPSIPSWGDWVAGKRRDINVDKYVEAISKLALWLDLQISTSVLKLLFGKLMSSKICLTLSLSYKGTLSLSSTSNVFSYWLRTSRKRQWFCSYRIKSLGRP